MKKGVKRMRHARAINKVEKMIAEALPDITGRLIELALGVTVEGVNKKGESVVFTKPPDRQSAEYLVDLIFKSGDRHSSAVQPVAIRIIEVSKSVDGVEV